MEEADPSHPGSSSAPRASSYKMPPDEGDGDGHDHPFASPRQAAKRVMTYFSEFREFLSYYVMARADGLRLSVRQMVIYAGLGVIGLVLAAAALMTGVVLLLLGCAYGLGNLLGLWAGCLIVGFATLALIGVVTLIGLKRIAGTSRKKTEQKYEQRQQWQQKRFGRTLAEQAAAGKPQ